ncbi:hypothetical protein CapIbe_006665 [Capra ibex]
MSQEFPEPLRTAQPRPAESRLAQGGQRCLGTGGGRPRAGRSAAVSEPRLVAGTRAELPGAGAAVLAAGVCQAPHPPRDRLRDPTRRGAAGNLEGDEGKTLLLRNLLRLEIKEFVMECASKVPRTVDTLTFHSPLSHLIFLAFYS